MTPSNQDIDILADKIYNDFLDKLGEGKLLVKYVCAICGWTRHVTYYPNENLTVTQTCEKWLPSIINHIESNHKL